jgi:Ran-binding protein 1
LLLDANNFKDSFMKAQKENEEIFNKAQEADAPAS